MVSIACSGKLHAFALAEQMQKHGLLDFLYTTYASQKNTFLKQWVKRNDKENIHPSKIKTNTLLAFPIKLNQSNVYTWNNFFDQWVASNIKKTNSKVFIGWSGMSLHAIRAAKKSGMITIVERGSSHIEYQNEILKEEYKKFGKAFSIDARVIKKELKEYEEADFISIPSTFVKNSFIQKGIQEEKLILNHYGASTYFQKPENIQKNHKFTILYLGTLSIRKGLIYLLEGLHSLTISEKEYEVWFIGSIENDLKETIEKYKKSNWYFKGHIEHYQLPNFISQCHVAVQPSLEEGMSMVVPQMLNCGVPVIATTNTGAEDIIQQNETGFIIPIRNPKAIEEKITELFNKPDTLRSMQIAALQQKNILTWDNYGNRYVQIINSLEK